MGAPVTGPCSSERSGPVGSSSGSTLTRPGSSMRATSACSFSSMSSRPSARWVHPRDGEAGELGAGGDGERGCHQRGCRRQRLRAFRLARPTLPNVRAEHGIRYARGDPGFVRDRTRAEAKSSPDHHRRRAPDVRRPGQPPRRRRGFRVRGLCRHPGPRERGGHRSAARVAVRSP